MKTFKYMCLVMFVSWYQLADCHPASTNLQSMDAMIEKESDIFLAAEADDSSHKSPRDKRTIGFLRQLFPQLSQIVDRKIQQITRYLFRVIGRLVLRGGAPGNGAGAGTGNSGDTSGNSGGRRISITLPTYPPLPDDEEEEQSTEIDSSTLPSSPSSSVAPSAAGAESTTGTPVTTEATLAPVTSTLSPVTSTQTTPSDMDNQLLTDSAGKKKRVAREVSSTDAAPSLVNQKSATLTETANESSSINESSLPSDDTEETNQEDPRNKRFSFNLRGGGGGGSGNFLFDLIRLVAGSGAPQDRDESSNIAGLEVDPLAVPTDATVKEDGYNVGVPGPLTRIFVLTNRGIANILQDLILRLAQTTERIVNFKARLITSLI